MIMAVSCLFVLVNFQCFAWTGTSILVRTAQEAHWTQIQITTGLQGVSFTTLYTLSLWRIVIHFLFLNDLGAFIWTPLVVLLNHYVFESDLIAGGMSSISICTCLHRAVLKTHILLFQFVHILREMDWISRCTLCWIGVFGCCFWIPRYVGIVLSN